MCCFATAKEKNGVDVSNEFVMMVYVVLPFVGMALSVWGFIEKEK